MTKYDILCPMCCGCFHETTGHFRHDQPAKGHFFTAKQHIRDAGWSTFPEYESTEYANVACPSCGTPYLDSLGRVQRMIPIGECEEITDEADLNAKMDALMGEYDSEPPASFLSSVPNEQLNDSKISCPVCGERFKSLHQHMRAKHQDYEAI